MHKFFLIILLSALNTNLFAQNKFGVLANFGPSFAAGQDMSDMFNIGLQAGFSAKFNLSRELFYIMPTTRFKFFEKKNYPGNPSHDTAVILKGGLEFLCRFGEYGKMQWYPFLGCFYNFLGYSKTDGLISVSGGTNGPSQNVTTGNAFSYSFGLIIEYKNFQVMPEFEFFNPTLPIKEEILNSSTNTKFTEPEYKFKYNTFNLTVGIYLKRR